MLNRKIHNCLLKAGDYESVENLSRFVRLRNAHLVHQKSYTDYQDRSRSTNFAELLNICHKLSRLLSNTVSSSPGLSQSLDQEEAQIAPYPQRIVDWDDLPELQEMVWNFLDERTVFSNDHVFPSEFQCKLVEHSIYPICSSKDVYNFRHQTVHRFLRLIWTQLLSDETIITSCLRDAYHCLADPCGIATSTLEFELQADSADCRVYLLADRHEFPIFFVQYLSTQELPTSQIRQQPTKLHFGRDVLNGGGMQSAFIAAVTRAYARMLSTGERSCLLDTGEALVFLQADGARPDVLRILKYIPVDELGEDAEGDADKTVVAQYLTFALVSLQDVAPSQKWDEEIDQKCPNARDHGIEYHEIDSAVLLNILYNQLAQSDQPYAFRPIHLHGKHHHYLKGAIPGYGYTFLAKAAETGYVEELENEFRIYQNLPASQGFEIPVCLGMVDFKACIGRSHTYYGKECEKVLLLSCSGVSAVSVVDKGSVDHLTEDRKMLELELGDIAELAAMSTGKVDLSWCNLVWNQQEERLVWINFLFWQD
ncbi:hypothetical protein PISL3812_03535 [Talaromyces islandicus]|uniref:Uncharacterized protein n=1 Tax=Talaromyces islandicus TaxID=28573 RepID=A0A0U1LT07_TALIS|nr:hypothetical protein PISL3812_03535 [Talaromyces islandicus]